MNLVGGSPTPLKNMKANGKDDIRYIIEKKMFETTNQVSMWKWPLPHFSFSPKAR